MRRRLPDEKNRIPLQCSKCKTRDLSLAIAEHQKCEKAEAKRTEKRKEQAQRNEGLGPLAKVDKVLGQANTALGSVVQWFQKLEIKGPSFAQAPVLPRGANWPTANSSAPGHQNDIPLETLGIRPPEPTYHPSVSPLTPRAGNQSSVATTGGHKKQDEEKVTPITKENNEN